MENEQTIDAICSDLVRYSETVHSGASRAMRRAEHALLSAGRQLAAKDAEIERLKADADRYRWLRLQHWSTGPLCVVKSPKNAVKLGHDCPSRQLLDSAIDAEISAPAKPAEPVLGEWVEWKGGACPFHQPTKADIRFRDGMEGCDSRADLLDECHWEHDGSYSDIVAYRIIL